MGSESPSYSAANAHKEGSNYDEIYMQHSLLFSDSLKDLKNLRKQLYSAAEYFELSYGKDEHKQLVVETLKDYVSKALVSSVDHLGSVACKLNGFLDEKVDEISTTKLRFSCMEQKLRACQEYVDRSGLLEQSLIILTPKQHKRYIVTGNYAAPSSILDAAETQPAVSKTRQRNKEHNVCYQDDLQIHKQGDCFPHPFQAPTMKPHPSLHNKNIKRHNSKISWTDASPNPPNFSFTRIESSKEVGKRSVSPFRFPLKRAGSVASRSASPSISNNKARCPSEPRRAISMPMNQERNREMDSQAYIRKSKSSFKALLSLHGHGSKKAGIPSRYLD